MNLEIKNYLIKMIKMNLNCFKISYISVQGGYSETLLDNARERVKKRLVDLFENLEFIYIINEPGKKFKISFIVCFRPIISPSLDENSLYSIIHELYMLYDNFKMEILKNICDIDFALKSMKIKLKYSNHTIVNFSRFFTNQHASLRDFLVGNFDKKKDYFSVEITKYSLIKGNFNLKFDEYSLFNLIEIYLRDLGINNDEDEIIGVIKQLKKKENVLEQFLKDKYTFQTGIIDLHELFIRHADTLHAIILKRKKND